MDSRAVRQIFTLANSFKEGDLAVGGTRDDRVREDARAALGAITVGEIRQTAFVEDDVTTALDRSRDPRFDRDLDQLTVTQLKTALLGLLSFHQYARSHSIRQLARIPGGNKLTWSHHWRKCCQT